MQKIFSLLAALKKTIRQIFIEIAAFTLIAIMGLLSSSDVEACASCGCMLSSDWDNLQFSSMLGLKLDLRYDYVNQDQLRSVTNPISPSAVAKPQEIEKFTRNNYLTLSADYTFSREWGVNVQIPYIYRVHETLGTASDGYVPGIDGGQYNSNTSSFGDIKVLGRYQGFISGNNLGVLFGFKLPTGSYTMTGTSTDPTAPGPVTIDKGLQPGSGTTDMILGIYYTDTMTQSFDYFTQVMFQTALYSTDQYRPGEGINLNLGLRYSDLNFIFPQIQLNFRYVLHDTGKNADTVSTGGTLLYLSPGVSVPIGDQVTAYGFVQIPIYENVNGVQLTPSYTISLGGRYIL